MSEPDFYRQSHEITQATLERLSDCEQSLEASLERWMELESLAAGNG